MNIQTSIKEVADFLTEIEGTEADIVEVRPYIITEPADQVQVELTVTLGVSDDELTQSKTEERVQHDDVMAPQNKNGESRLHGDALARSASPPSHGTASASPPSRSSPDETDYPCPVDGCGRSFESKHGLRIHYAKIHGEASGQDVTSSEVAYKDPLCLEQIYDSSKTFDEMAAELDVDVSGSTVRRHMIEFGIHSPTSYDGAGSPDEADATSPHPEKSAVDEDETATDDDESSTLPAQNDEPINVEFDRLAATFGIDSALTLDDFTWIVNESDTLYEVQRRLEIEREDVKQLLLELDLLDAVFGRVSTKDQRDITVDEINQRIRNSVQQQKNSSSPAD